MDCRKELAELRNVLQPLHDIRFVALSELSAEAVEDAKIGYDRAIEIIDRMWKHAEKEEEEKMNYWEPYVYPHAASPKTDQALPFLVQILEYDGVPMTHEIMDRYGPDGIFALHGGDWGSVERIMQVVAEAHDGCMSMDDPKSVTFRIVRKTGEVVRVVRIATAFREEKSIMLRKTEEMMKCEAETKAGGC